MREVLGAQRSIDSREESCVELANVRNRHSRRDLEDLVSLSVVDVQKKRGYLKSRETATCRDRLRCDVLHSLACVESHDLILPVTKTPREGFHRFIWDFPNRVCLFIIKLGGSVEKELSK